MQYRYLLSTLFLELTVPSKYYVFSISQILNDTFGNKNYVQHTKQTTFAAIVDEYETNSIIILYDMILYDKLLDW